MYVTSFKLDLNKTPEGLVGYIRDKDTIKGFIDKDNNIQRIPDVPLPDPEITNVMENLPLVVPDNIQTEKYMVHILSNKPPPLEMPSMTQPVENPSNVTFRYSSKENVLERVSTKLKEYSNIDINSIDLVEYRKKLNKDFSNIPSPELSREIIDVLYSNLKALKELSDSKQTCDTTIKDLRRQLTDIYTKNDAEYSKECNGFLFEEFKRINNIYHRKWEAINGIEKYLEKNSEHKNSEAFERYIILKEAIEDQISMLNLNDFVKSDNIDLLKNNKEVDPEFCEKIQKIVDVFSELKNDIKEQDNDLINVFEDITGSIRTFSKELKVNEVSDDLIELTSLGVSLKCNGKTFNYKFFNSFDGGQSTLSVYTGVPNSTSSLGNVLKISASNPPTTKGVWGVFKQVQDNYSVVLAGFGGSGTGKTTLLLGNDSAPGLIHYGLENLDPPPIGINVKYIFEQYIDKFTPTLGLITGKIINLYGNIPVLKKYQENETQEFLDALGDTSLNDISTKDISHLFKTISDYRLAKRRIKKTPNNPVSSRSHLFVVFQVITETGSGYATIIDSAGKEDPIEIFNTFTGDFNGYKTNLTTVLGPTSSVSAYAKYMKDKSYDPRDAIDILKESFYINETLNHFSWFFNERNGTNVQKKISFNKTLEGYSPQKFYIDPKTEKTGINASKNVLTIPILNFLDTGMTSGTKPTKFVMIGCYRPEPKYCSVSNSTLSFVSSLGGF